MKNKINFNNGKPIEIDFQSQTFIQNKSLMAKEFSEGEKNLERLLLILWDHKIKTFACCKGHRERDNVESVSFPYFSFILTKNIDIQVLEEIIKTLKQWLADVVEIKLVKNNQLYRLTITWISSTFNHTNSDESLNKESEIFFDGLFKIFKNAFDLKSINHKNDDVEDDLYFARLDSLVDKKIILD